MYKIPADLNLLEIKNEKISHITFGRSIIVLSFSKGAIQFSGAYSFYCKGVKKSFDEVYPISTDSGLLLLLEKKITSVYSNVERNNLTLEFDEGIVLELLSDENYESFEITINQRRVIV